MGLGIVVVVLAMGLLVVERSPGLRIGLLLLGFAALLSLSRLSQQVTAAVILDGGDEPWWARFLVYATQASWVLLYGTSIALAFVFPTGRCLTRRWRWVLGRLRGGLDGVVPDHADLGRARLRSVRPCRAAVRHAPSWVFFPLFSRSGR